VPYPQGYLLRLGPRSLDAARFAELASAGRSALDRGDSAAASATAQQAIALWRGRALGGLADEAWARPEAQRLEEARPQTLELRLEADLALGRHASVVGELERLASEHPLREHLLASLMLGLYRCGRQAEALDVCRAARRRRADRSAGQGVYVAQGEAGAAYAERPPRRQARPGQGQ